MVVSINDLLEAAVANSARLFELAAAILLSRDSVEIDRINDEIQALSVEAASLQARLTAAAKLMSLEGGTVH